jgi:CBS domain-containing protein
VGTKIAEAMTDRPRAVTPQTSVRDAARLMEEEDVGSLPIVEEGARLVGILTDRDVTVRVVGRGLDPDATPVGDVASRDVVALTPDHDLDEALMVMAREQVRRVPIVVRENQLVGMLSQADVARAGKEKATGGVVEAISRAPRGPRVAGPDVGSSDVAGSQVAGSDLGGSNVGGPQVAGSDVGGSNVGGQGTGSASSERLAEDDRRSAEPPQQDEGSVR